MDKYYELLFNGKLKDIEEIRESLRKRVDYCRKKPWAVKVNGMIAYLAIPTAIADVLIGTGNVGFGAAVLGTVSQFITDTLEKRKSRSWLSIGREIL